MKLENGSRFLFHCIYYKEQYLKKVSIACWHIQVFTNHVSSGAVLAGYSP